jgi:hypothetical protein
LERIIAGAEAYARPESYIAKLRTWVRHHHPVCPDFWLHPNKDTFEIGPDEHHNEFFLAHPELFGKDLAQAFADGWVSIRRWAGGQEVWAIRCEHFQPIAHTFSRWASACLRRLPHEAETPIRVFTSNGEIPTPHTLADLASGMAAPREIVGNQRDSSS